MKLVETIDMIEILDKRIDQIPKVQTCEYSEIQNGRLWCNYYNRTMAGRCPSCPNYKLKNQSE